MRILLVSTSVVPVGAGRYGGIEKMCYDLAGGLARAGHLVDIAAPVGSEPPEGVRLLQTVKLPEEQDKDGFALERWVSESDGLYDCIHDFSHGHALGRADAHISNKYPLTPAATFMVWDPIEVKYPKSRYNICCVSTWQAVRFCALYQQDAKVFPSWGYVDSRKYHPAGSPTRERFLFLGKLTPNKGAIEAIRLARQAGVGLDVVGGLIPSDGREYAQKLMALQGDGVRLFFNIPEWQKIELLQNAKAVLYPLQFDEAHNLVAIEAAAVHTPMISYARGALPSLGITHVVESEKEFLEAMKTVDEWFVPSETDWSVDSRIPKYIEFYQSIAEGLRW